MKNFIEQRLREGRFSTPSEYIRSLIRDDQDLSGKSELATLVRRVVMSKPPKKDLVSKKNVSKPRGKNNL